MDRELWISGYKELIESKQRKKIVRLRKEISELCEENERLKKIVSAYEEQLGMNHSCFRRKR